ncbi:MAG: AmmeMemoRadiSam system protein A [Thiogranum sp.]|nr:AmmeMemoRadiSam system protein A [Thiogranum sp.]
MAFTEQQRATLLRIVHQSIEHGLHRGIPLQVDPDDYESPLCKDRASFVTLHRCEKLRGCVGSIEARRPLIRDVTENAYAAAFRDARFQRLQKYELEGLTVSISVLSPPQMLQIDNEKQLLERLRPGVDGVILEDGSFRSTFLPSVWTSLPRPEDFLQHLKLKAGLPIDHWSCNMRIWIYTTECFGDTDSRATSTG